MAKQKKTEIERVYERHYRDMMHLTHTAIQSIRVPNRSLSEMPEIKTLAKKLTRKQLKALAEGRKKLASKRAKVIQI